MEEPQKIKCILNDRESKVAIILGVLSYILYRVYPHINVWRLTPTYMPRQFFVNIEPGTIVSVIGACITGSWGGLILSLFSWSPIFNPEIIIIVKAAQLMTIGYIHRKIQPPWNIFSIPFGLILSAPIHPTIIHYIFYRQVIVLQYWHINLLFQIAISFCTYILIRLSFPSVFKWVYPLGDFSLKLSTLLKTK